MYDIKTATSTTAVTTAHTARNIAANQDDSLIYYSSGDNNSVGIIYAYDYATNTEFTLVDAATLGINSTTIDNSIWL